LQCTSSSCANKLESLPYFRIIKSCLDWEGLHWSRYIDALPETRQASSQNTNAALSVFIPRWQGSTVPYKRRINGSQNWDKSLVNSRTGIKLLNKLDNASLFSSHRSVFVVKRYAPLCYHGNGEKTRFVKYTRTNRNRSHLQNNPGFIISVKARALRALLRTRRWK